MTPSEVVDVDDLRDIVRLEARPAGTDNDKGTLREFKETSERAFLVGKLRENGWNISKTAEVIGTPRSNLYKKLEQYRHHAGNGRITSAAGDQTIAVRRSCAVPAVARKGEGGRRRAKAEGGKSELRRAVRRVTPGQGNLKESGTENIPPDFALRATSGRPAGLARYGRTIRRTGREACPP